MSDKYVPTEATFRMLEQLSGTLRSRYLGLPSKTAAHFGTFRTAVQLQNFLRDAINDILTEINKLADDDAFLEKAARETLEGIDA